MFSSVHPPASLMRRWLNGICRLKQVELRKICHQAPFTRQLNPILVVFVLSDIAERSENRIFLLVLYQLVARSTQRENDCVASTTVVLVGWRSFKLSEPICLEEALNHHTKL